MPKPVITEALGEKIAEMREERGWTCARIARALGLKEATVRNWCFVQGIEPPKRAPLDGRSRRAGAQVRGGRVQRFFTPEEDAELLRLEAEGLSWNAIGRALGRRHNSVRFRAIALGRRAETAAGSMLASSGETEIAA